MRLWVMQPDQLRRYVYAHAVVESPPCENHLWVKADLGRLVRQIIRIDPNAVPAHQSGSERHEIPLRTRRLQHFLGIDAEPLEYERQLVDQSDVDVTLRVLDDLCSLRNANAACPMRAGGHDGTVELVDEFRRLWRRSPKSLCGSL